MAHQMAEYTVDGIGGYDNSRTPSDSHGQFVGHVDSDESTQHTPRKRTGANVEIELDMDRIAEMQREHEEKLARMEAGGSYWSE